MTRDSVEKALEIDKLIKDIPELEHHRLYDTKIGACILEIKAYGDSDPLLVRTSRGELVQILLSHLSVLGPGRDAEMIEELRKIREGFEKFALELQGR